MSAAQQKPLGTRQLCANVRPRRHPINQPNKGDEYDVIPAAHAKTSLRRPRARLPGMPTGVPCRQDTPPAPGAVPKYDMSHLLCSSDERRETGTGVAAGAASRASVCGTR